MCLLQFFAVFCRADSLTKIEKISSVSCIFKLYRNAVWASEHEWNITVDFCKRMLLTVIINVGILQQIAV